MSPALSNDTFYRLPKPEEPTSEYHDIVLSFDTTGSMSKWIEQIRQDLDKFVPAIFAKYENVKIAIIAHGDYCDVDTYITKAIDFTRDMRALQNFVQTVEDTGGGDTPECYEYVLKMARTNLTWRAGSKRQLIMFGDAMPHEFEEFGEIMENFPHVKEQLDWRDEADELKRMNVEIEPMQYGVGSDPKADLFWESLAHKTYGYRLQVEKPEEMRVIITAAVYRGQGKEHLAWFEKEVRLGPDADIANCNSFNVCINRLGLEAGSAEAIGPTKAHCYVQETEEENGLRRAQRDQERIRNGMVVANQAMADTVDRLANQLRNLNEEKANLQSNLQQAHLSLEKARNDNNTSNTMIVDLNREIDDLQQRLKKSQEDIANLQQSKSDQENDLVILREEKSQLEESSKAEQTRLNSELTTTKNELETTANQVYELEMERGEHLETIADLKETLKERDEQEWKAAIISEEDLQINGDKVIGLGLEMGQKVCEGLHKGFNQVAVKKFKVSEQYSDDAIRTSIRELRKLQHPNLAVVFGALDPFAKKPHMTIVIEKADSSLHNAVINLKAGQSPIDDKKRMVYLRDAATGLAYMHSLNLIHKAIKPGNILMVGSTGKLTDFCIGGMTKDAPTMYKARELYTGSPQPDMRSDVWAFGITMLEVLTAKKIQSQTGTTEEGIKIPQILLDEKMPEALDKIYERRKELVQKCLKYDPEQRVQSRNIPRLLSDMIRV